MGKIAVLASGSGSNFEAIQKAFKGTAHTIEVLICNKKNAFALTRAQNLGVPAKVVSYKDRSREKAEREMLQIIRDCDTDLVVLAGFMKLLTPTFIDPLENRIINIHPALLPRHPGAHGIEDSWNAGDAELGISIHYVDHGTDTGPLIAQFAFPRDKKDTLESVEEKIHALEHKHYPAVLIKLLDKIDLEDK